MADSPKQDKILLDYWKYFPERVLLSEKIESMSARQFGAYWWIVSRTMIESLPGVVPFDEIKLAKWGKLKSGEWEKDRAVILAPFFLHARTCTLHHPFVKELYLDHFLMIHRCRLNGKAGGLKKGGQKTPKGPLKAPYSHPIATPYDIFEGSLISLDGADISAVAAEMVAKGGYRPPIGVLNGGSSKVGRYVSTTHTAEETAPLGLGGPSDAANNRSLTTATLRKTLSQSRTEVS